MDDRPIGIFDSGSGGLSIWAALIAQLPNESTVYFGDHKNIPYNSKTSEFIQSRAMKIISELSKRNAKLIVVACNTATVAGIDNYRRAFPKIPIIGVVPVIKSAASKSKKKRFAVLSTEFTARSKYQKQLIETYANDCIVLNIGCPNLVSHIERGASNTPEITQELQQILMPLIKQDIDVIALGCTHYPFLNQTIRSIVGDDVQLLDSGGAVARHVARVLEKNNALANPLKMRAQESKYEFYTSGNAKHVTRVFEMLTARKEIFTYVQI